MCSDSSTDTIFKYIYIYWVGGGDGEFRYSFFYLVEGLGRGTMKGLETDCMI